MVKWFLYKKIRDGGKGSGNFGHKGRPGQVGGSAKVGSSAELNKLSVDLNLADIDDHLSKTGIRKGDVVKVFGLRKDVLLSHAQNCMKAKEEGKFWRGVFKDEASVQEARDLLAKYDAGELEKDAGYTKLSRSLARYDFVTGLVNGEVEPKIAKAEESKQVEEPIEPTVAELPPKMEEPIKKEKPPKISASEGDLRYAKSGEVEVNREFNTFSNQASQHIAKELLSNINTDIPSGTRIKSYFGRLYHGEDKYGDLADQKNKLQTLFEKIDKKDEEAYKNALESHVTDLETFFEKMDDEKENNKMYLYQFARNLGSLVGTWEWYDRSLINKGKIYKYKQRAQGQVKGQLLSALATLNVMQNFDKKMKAVNEEYNGIADIIDPTKHLMSADDILKSGVLDEALAGFITDKKEIPEYKKRAEECIRNYVKEFGNFNPFSAGFDLHLDISVMQPLSKSAEVDTPFDWKGNILAMKRTYFDTADMDDKSVQAVAVGIGMLAMDKKLKLDEYVKKVKETVIPQSDISLKSSISRDEEAVKKTKNYIDDFESRQIGQVLTSQTELDNTAFNGCCEILEGMIKDFGQEGKFGSDIDSAKFKEKLDGVKELVADGRSQARDFSFDTTKDLGFWLRLTNDYNEHVGYGDIYKKYGKDVNVAEQTKKAFRYKQLKEDINNGYRIALEDTMNYPIAVSYAKRVGEDFEKLNQANSYVIEALTKNPNFKGENVFQIANDIVSNGHLSHVFGQANGMKTDTPFTFDMAGKVPESFEKGDNRAYASICLDAFKKAGIIKENNGVMNTSQNRLFEGYKKASEYSDISNSFVNTGVKLTNDELNHDKSMAIAKENIKKMFPSIGNIDELMDSQKLQANSQPKDRGKYGKSIDDVTKWREHLTALMDDKTGSSTYVWTGDDMQYLVSAMTMGGGNYNDIKEYDQFGSQSFMNSVVANSPNTEVPLYRFENMRNGYRNYDLKVGDSIQFDSQHFTWNEKFAMNNASVWFGEGAPVLFRINGKKPFYNFEQRVGKGWDPNRASTQCKGIVEYEGSMAGNCKITGQSKIDLPNGNSAIVYDCEYDYDSREAFTNLNLKQFAYLNKMYGEEKDGKKN